MAFNMCLFFIYDRVTKEQASTQLSPVKKRVKENTPPQYNNNNNNNSMATATHGRSGGNVQQTDTTANVPTTWTETLPAVKYTGSRRDRQPIVIADSPSPAVSVITISSDSEEDDDAKVCKR